MKTPSTPVKLFFVVVLVQCSINWDLAYSQKAANSKGPSRAVIFRDENNTSFQGSIEVPGDTIFVVRVDSASSTADTLKITLDQVLRISMHWKYARDFHSTVLFQQGAPQADMSAINVTASPQKLEFTLSDQSKFMANIESVMPKQLIFHTKIKQQQVQLDLPLETFKETLANNADKRRYALQAPIPTNKKSWRTTFATLDFSVPNRKIEKK